MRYLIKLRPLENFFFGSERTFGADNEYYFVTSNPFPQQTTILGMLRRELLLQNGLAEQTAGWDIIRDIPKAEEAIGKISFSITPEDRQDFGWIETISPVFISNGESFYNKMPYDDNFDYEKREEKPKQSLLGLLGIKNFIPFMKEYNPKKPLNKNFIRSGDNKHLKFDEVFVPVTQVGITKNNRRNSEEEKGFFKQTSFAFASKDLAFTFFLDLDNQAKLDPSIVFLGAESSAFSMEVKKIDGEAYKSFTELFHLPRKPSQNYKRIVLLSDTYAEDTIFTVCDFALTRLKPFRNIANTTAAYREGSDNHINVRPSKKRFNLIEKGSVLYAEDIEKLKSFLDKPNCRQIGYNIYQIVQ